MINQLIERLLAVTFQHVKIPLIDWSQRLKCWYLLVLLYLCDIKLRVFAECHYLWLKSCFKKRMIFRIKEEVYLVNCRPNTDTWTRP